MNETKKSLGDRSDQLLLIMVVLFLGAGMALGQKFIAPANFVSVMTGFAGVGFVSIGMMMLLISGVFDLSVGSVYAIGMVTVAHFLTKLALPWPLAVLAALLICAACGAVNGFLVTKMKINPLIATLGTMGILRGVAVMIGGVGQGGLPASFKTIGQGEFLGLGGPIWLFLLTLLAFIIMFRYLRFFRKFYFVGGNKDAATLCGISPDRTWFSGYVIMSVIAGFAGILYCSRLGSSTGLAGEGMELQVIAGVVIGGASIKGGKGTILGGVLGTFFMVMVFNIMSIAGVDAYWQQIVNGSILILAVYSDVLIGQGHHAGFFGALGKWGGHKRGDS